MSEPVDVAALRTICEDHSQRLGLDKDDLVEWRLEIPPGRVLEILAALESARRERDASLANVLELADALRAANSRADRNDRYGSERFQEAVKLQAERDTARVEAERLRFYETTSAADAVRELVAARAEAEQLRSERDEARQLKVPPTVDELLAANMAAATAQAEAEQLRAERDAAVLELDRLRGGTVRMVQNSTAESIAAYLDNLADGYGKTTPWKALRDAAWEIRNTQAWRTTKGDAGK